VFSKQGFVCAFAAPPAMQSDYERERELRVAANKRRLGELVTARVEAPSPAPKARRKNPGEPRTRPPPPPPRSLSARLRGEAAPELMIDEHDRIAGTVLTAAERKWAPGASICHCCRQIHANTKAICTSEDCNVRWCANCLRNKCGEDAEEVNARGDWRCGRCLGNCMCSMCRRKAGLKPLGALWPIARDAGYASVAAYLKDRGEM
jgi:hypothetical protein